MNTQHLAAHLLKTLFILQTQGRPASLDLLVDLLKVRRADVRRLITLLHQEGYIDALRMRLTLRGLALGSALATRSLHPLRTAAHVASAA